MGTSPGIEEKTFSALADGHRRKIIELLHVRDSTLLELANHFSITFQALSKHIRILEQAGIVSKRKKGKYRILSLNRDALQPSLDWISHYFTFWKGSLQRLDNLIQMEKTEDDIE